MVESNTFFCDVNNGGLNFKLLHCRPLLKICCRLSTSKSLWLMLGLQTSIALRVMVFSSTQVSTGARHPRSFSSWIFFIIIMFRRKVAATGVSCRPSLLLLQVCTASCSCNRTSWLWFKLFYIFYEYPFGNVSPALYQLIDHIESTVQFTGKHNKRKRICICHGHLVQEVVGKTCNIHKQCTERLKETQNLYHYIVR